jgi:hypothetical protein
MTQTYSECQAAISRAQPTAFVGGYNLLTGDKGPKSLNLRADFGATGIPPTGYYIDLTSFFAEVHDSIDSGASVSRDVFPDNVDRVDVMIDDQNIMICIAMGYPDESFVANTVKSVREDSEKFVRYVGF